jgi:hypothetical protein
LIKRLYSGKRIEFFGGLPDEARKSLSIWASCIGGALPLKQYLAAIEKAGFVNVNLLANTDYPKEFIEETMKTSKIDYNQDISISHAEIQAYKS